MADTLLVLDVDPQLLARLQRRAALHGRSAEDEAREILRGSIDHAAIDFDQRSAELRRRTAKLVQTPSEELLREMRDER